jgi:hypothetical protein
MKRLVELRFLFRWVNTLVLAFIFGAYVFKADFFNTGETIWFYLFNFGFIYLLQIGADKTFQSFSPRPSKLKAALKGKSKEYQSELWWWQLKKEAGTAGLTGLLYFMMLAVISWLQLAVLVFHNTWWLIDLNPLRLIQAVVMLLVYISVIFSAGIYIYDLKEGIKRKDSLYYGVIAVLGLIYILGQLLIEALKSVLG